MCTKTGRQVMHTAFMIMLMMMTAMSMKVTVSSSRQFLSPLPSPASLHLHPLEQQLGQNQIQPTTVEDDDNFILTALTDNQNQAMIVEEDYGYWNPTPYFGGGGDTAPIPHAKVSCSDET
ncbi:unnamed protein product [Camellia sinensis]